MKKFLWEITHKIFKLKINQSVIYENGIDLIINGLLISHLSLYTRLKPTYDKKIEIMDLLYIIIINGLLIAHLCLCTRLKPTMIRK